MKTKVIISAMFISTLLWRAAGDEVYAQGVGINTTGNNPSSYTLLDVDAGSDNNKGVLIPRIALSNVNTLAPITGTTGDVVSLLVYNTNASVTGGNGAGYYYWDGSRWRHIPAPDNPPGAVGQVLTSKAGCALNGKPSAAAVDAADAPL